MPSDVSLVNEHELEQGDVIPLLPTSAEPTILEQPAGRDVGKAEFVVRGWPTQPTTISRAPFHAVLHAGPEVFAFSITLPYIVLAVFIAKYDNSPVSDSDTVYRYVVKLGTNIVSAPCHLVLSTSILTKTPPTSYTTLSPMFLHSLLDRQSRTLLPGGLHAASPWATSSRSWAA